MLFGIGGCVVTWGILLVRATSRHLLLGLASFLLPLVLLVFVILDWKRSRTVALAHMVANVIVAGALCLLFALNPDMMRFE